MKELSIEEKAKHYDEALDNAKVVYKTIRKDLKPVIEQIFPELAESEDERIRKELIDFVKSRLAGFPQCEKYIAWIERQCEEKSMKVYRVENEAEQKGLWRKFDGTYQPLFDMLTDGKCKDLPMEDSPIYREGGNRWFASAPSKETLQKWFSKKDLEELVAKGFTISEFEVVGYKKVSDFEYIFTRDNIINRNYLEVSDIYPEQKVFAPKFKVGDWVVNKFGDVWHIDSFDKKIYQVSDGKGNYNYFSISRQDEMRLWTIQDSKDGDVLVGDWYQGDDYWEKIIIFKKYHNKGIEGLIYAPCVEGYGNTFKNGKMAFVGEVPDYSKTWTDNLHPATKEQREQLEKAMSKAGYKWNKEERKLEKI